MKVLYCPFFHNTLVIPFLQLLSIFNNKNIFFQFKNYFSTLIFLMPSIHVVSAVISSMFISFFVGHSRLGTVWQNVPTTKYLKKEHMPIILWKCKPECSLCSKNNNNIFLLNKVVWRMWLFFFANKKLTSYVNTAFEQLSKFLFMTPEDDHCTSQWLKQKLGNRALSSVKSQCH